MIQAGRNIWLEPVSLSKSQRRLLEEPLPAVSADNVALMSTLAWRGVLTASLSGWQRFLQDSLRVSGIEDIDRLVLTLMMMSEVAPSREAKTLPRQEQRQEKGVRDSVPTAISKRVRECEKQGDIQGARTILEAETRPNPQQFSAWYLLGNINLRSENYRDALPALQQAVALCPDWENLYFEIGSVFHHLHLNIQGMRLARAILRIHKRHAASWDLLGSLMRKTDDLNRAEYCARIGRQNSTMRCSHSGPQFSALTGAQSC